MTKLGHRARFGEGPHLPCRMRGVRFRRHVGPVGPARRRSHGGNEFAPLRLANARPMAESLFPGGPSSDVRRRWKGTPQRPGRRGDTSKVVAESSPRGRTNDLPPFREGTLDVVFSLGGGPRGPRFSTRHRPAVAQRALARLGPIAAAGRLVFPGPSGPGLHRLQQLLALPGTLGLRAGGRARQLLPPNGPSPVRSP